MAEVVADNKAEAKVECVRGAKCHVGLNEPRGCVRVTDYPRLNLAEG